MTISKLTKLDSIFDADCPQCGLPLQATTTDRAVEGLVWECAACGFRSERSGGILIDTMSEPQPLDR